MTGVCQSVAELERAFAGWLGWQVFAHQFPLAGEGGFVVGAWHGRIVFELLKADPTEMDGLHFGFGDHRWQKTAGIAEGLKPVLPCDGREIPRGTKVESGG